MPEVRLSRFLTSMSVGGVRGGVSFVRVRCGAGESGGENRRGDVSGIVEEERGER